MYSSRSKLFTEAFRKGRVPSPHASGDGINIPVTLAVRSVDPSKDSKISTQAQPLVGLGAVACFGTGSGGFLKLGDRRLTNEGPKGPIHRVYNLAANIKIK